MDYDLLILDCDGVLIDSEMLAIRAMCRVLNAAGVAATEDLVLGCFGMKQSDALARIAAATGRSIPPDVDAQLWPATRAAFAAKLRPMPGVAAFLEARGGTPLCVASSSGPERIRASLAIAGLLPLFGEALFSSHQVSRGKPAPDLFLFAASCMGAGPDRCVVVEDSVFGIAGARAAGMAAIGFVGGSHIRHGHGEALLDAGAVAVAATWPEVAAQLAA